MLFLIAHNLWFIFVQINQGMKSCSWAQFIFRKIIPSNKKPVHNIVVLFFMMIYLFFKLIQVTIKAEEQLFRVQKVDGLLDMIMCCPISFFKMLPQDIIILFRVKMPLGLFVVRFPMINNLLLEFFQRCCDSCIYFFHKQLKVSSLLIKFILEIQSLIAEQFCQLFSIHWQFQSFHIGLRIVLQVNKFIFYFFLNLHNIFFSILRIKIKFMIMFGDTKLTAYAFGTKLAYTDDLLLQVMYGTFEHPLHFLYYVNQILNFKSPPLFMIISQTHPQAQAVKQQFQRSKGYITKGFITLFLSAGFLFYRFAFTMDFTSNCIYDLLHVVLYPINRWIDKDPILSVILIGQLLIDGFACTLFIYWMLWCKNIRMVNFVCVFYAIRSVFLALLYFPFPENIVWRAPPIPSIMVPYELTRDFFYSGHTGIAIILSMQMARHKLPKWSQYLGYFMVAWMPFMLITTRIHYTIDVLASPFYVMLTNDVNVKLGPCPDYVWSLPYIIYKKIQQIFCPITQESQDNRLIQENLI